MEIKKASLFKRISAAIMDLLLSLIVGYLIASFVCQPILIHTTDIEEKQQEYNEGLFDLGYVVIAESTTEDNKTKYKIVAKFSDETSIKDEYKRKIIEQSDKYYYISLSNSNLNITNTELDEFLTHFYSKIEAMDVYNNYKEQSPIFTKVETKNEEDVTYELKEDITVEEEKDFYLNVYSKLLHEKKYKQYTNENNQNIYNIGNYITGLISICIYIGLFIALLVFYLIIPLITKNGQTLGKKLMSLGVVNIKDGSRANKLSIIIRFMTLVIIELLLSTYLYYTPLVISVFIIILTQKGRAIHDFTARTAVVDLMYHDCSIETDSDVIEVEGKEPEKNNQKNQEKETVNEEKNESEIQDEIKNDNA